MQFLYLHICAQLCLTLCNPTECSLPNSSVHRIFQARILEQVAISYSRGSFQPGIEPASLASPALAGRFVAHRGSPVFAYTHFFT